MPSMPEITPPPLNLADYLGSLEDETYRNEIEHLFDAYEGIINHINRAIRVPFAIPPTPEIRITFQRFALIETGVGVIYISEAFIQKCLNTNFCQFHEVAGTPDPIRHNSKRFITSGAMIWALAHEYHHTTRKHDEVVAVLQNENNYDPILTSYALESDADLCAIAVLYRFIQQTFPIDDIKARQLAMYIVFWSIRSDFEDGHTRTHTSMGVRAWSISLKLAVLTPNEFGSPDIDFALPITRQRHKTIMDCFLACERYYLQHFRPPTSTINFGDIFLNDIQGVNSLNSQVTSRWDEIRGLVSELSGTRT